MSGLTNDDIKYLVGKARKYTIIAVAVVISVHALFAGLDYIVSSP